MSTPTKANWTSEEWRQNILVLINFGITLNSQAKELPWWKFFKRLKLIISCQEIIDYVNNSVKELSLETSEKIEITQQQH